MDLEKAILRKTGEAIGRYRMIRDGDRVAVGLSGGKDSVTLLEALIRLQKKAPIDFSVCAFTVEQGKFLAPIHAFRGYLEQRGIDWTYVQDGPSLRLLEEQPDHGCDLCSRFRRRAVYQIARNLRKCHRFRRQPRTIPAIFSSQCDVYWPPERIAAGRLLRKRDFRLIRPLLYVTEDLTRAFAERLGAPVIPCGCSQKRGQFAGRCAISFPNWSAIIRI